MTHARRSGPALMSVLALAHAALIPPWGQLARAQDVVTKARRPRAQTLIEGYRRAYTLAPGEELKRVAPPFPEGRNADVAVFYFRQAGDGLGLYSSNTGGDGRKGGRLVELLTRLLDLYPHEIEGKKELLGTFVEGDFVVRETVPLGRQVERLDVILREECKLPVRLSLREEARDVVVAKGRYSYRPTEGREGDVPEFDIYGLTRLGRGSIGHDRDFGRMLRWAGHFTEPNSRVVNEATGLPTESVRWRFYERPAVDERTRQEDHDKALIFEHLAEQTGLTFAFEERKVRVLFVEPEEKAGENGAAPK